MSEETPQEYLRSLEGKIIDFFVFGPGDILHIIAGARQGHPEAIAWRDVVRDCLATAKGMACLSCDSEISDGAGAFAFMSTSTTTPTDGGDSIGAAMPICWTCARKTDLAARARVGLTRTLLPGAKAFDPAMLHHTAGHA